MATAACLMLLVGCFVDVPYGWKWVLICLLSISPAGIDFALEELSAAYPCSNAFRFVTGFLFGAGGGVCLVWLFHYGKWMPTLSFVCVAVSMQFVIAMMFLKFGHLDDYLSKYERALGINIDHTASTDCHCSCGG